MESVRAFLQDKLREVLEEADAFVSHEALEKIDELIDIVLGDPRNEV